MNKIIFEKLKVKNFFSIGDEPVVLEFKNGLNFITGINKDLSDRQNGTGKSSVIDAFHFALFGETMRDLKKEFVINNLTNETSEVSLTFLLNDSKYEIYRSLKPNKCFLYKDGEDISRDSMANTTEHILSLLKMTPEIFLNCLCLSINSTVPFMAQKKIEKRKFIEGVFNLDVFSKMNVFLKEDYSSLKKEIEVKKDAYNNLQNNLKLIKEKNQKIIDEREIKIKNCENNISNYKSEISTIEGRLSQYKITDNFVVQNKILKLNEKEKISSDKKQSLIEKIASYTAKIELMDKNSAKIGTSEHKCPVCLKEITDNDKEHIDKEKQGIKLEIEKLNQESASSQKELFALNKEIELLIKAKSLLKDEISKNNLSIEKKKNDTEKLNLLKARIKDFEKEIESLKNLNIQENQDLKTYEDKLKTQSEELFKLNEEWSILENVKFALSEEGIKSFVVNKMLKLFNSKISHYLNALDLNISLKFDQYFDESIKNERGKETVYFNYSGAERKAIDLAIMFSFIDMLKMQSNVDYNIQFYDELLDTSLDSSGVENVLKILNEFVDDKKYGIYVVSHRKECSKMANGEVVFLEKQNGITKRVFLES